ncbi:MAG: hypothetical protein IKI44_03425, partial [Bacteroidaceae bacterium]|nr:hypothetical protein [Bacteroidaceae bacterium]
GDELDGDILSARNGAYEEGAEGPKESFHGIDVLIFFAKIAFSFVSHNICGAKFVYVVNNVYLCGRNSK